MRGQQPHPEDRQFPAMLQDLYATAAQRREGGAETFAALPNGWSRMDDRTLQQAGRHRPCPAARRQERLRRRVLSQ
ncbi:putative phospholipase A1 domain protein [Xanthomonas citri pv. mangiferaeindicae LMG 941]|nr:putative phospholipase A1 domain protein [Xanthomonas citri pv. mangiferaeindicae LMG 941]